MEVLDALETNSSDIQNALVQIVQAPAYGHTRMIQKAKQLGNTLPAKSTPMGWLRLLEDMYNHGYPEDNRARLY